MMAGTGDAWLFDRRCRNVEQLGGSERAPFGCFVGDLRCQSTC